MGHSGKNVEDWTYSSDEGGILTLGWKDTIPYLPSKIRERYLSSNIGLAIVVAVSTGLNQSPTLRLQVQLMR
jgi:hypothetical protein